MRLQSLGKEVLRTSFPGYQNFCYTGNKESQHQGGHLNATRSRVRSTARLRTRAHFVQCLFFCPRGHHCNSPIRIRISLLCRWLPNSSFLSTIWAESSSESSGGMYIRHQEVALRSSAEAQRPEDGVHADSTQASYSKTRFEFCHYHYWVAQYWTDASGTKPWRHFWRQHEHDRPCESCV